MCAQFLLKAKAKELEALFGIPAPKTMESIDTRILPHQKGLVVTAKGFEEMSYSLVPSWSKERRPKFATYNARIESLAEKPTWKKPLETKRCLVPLTAFIEPIYENDLAGNMVAFHAPDNSLLVAAGIYDEWMDPQSGDTVESFAIITREPLDYVRTVGHDRSPLFLPQKEFADWIQPQKKPAGELISLMQKVHQSPALAVDVDRPLKAGWEKRKG